MKMDDHKPYTSYIIIYHVTRCNLSMAQLKMACWNITARDFRRVRGFPVAMLDGDTENIEVVYN